MKERTKNIILVALMATCLFGLSVWCICKPPEAVSNSERRQLQQFPAWGADFTDKFNSYAADQFPLRQQFRTLYSVVFRDVLRQKQVNGIYFSNGYAAQAEYPLDTESIGWAVSSFRRIAEQYAADNSIYVSVIPDKNYFLAGDAGQLSLDYERLFAQVEQKTADFAQYIDLTGQLSIDNYYRTDTHWMQQTLQPVAESLAVAMGITLHGQWQENTLSAPFYGVYYGQAALPMQPDTITYLTNDELSDVQVTCWDNGRAEELPMYDMEKGKGRDGYELYLSGSRALITLDNPNATTDKRLILFRDSFAGSLAPLLCSGYRQITMVDIRYLSPTFLNQFVDFENADVLFLYSTLVLNNAKEQLMK